MNIPPGQRYESPDRVEVEVDAIFHHDNFFMDENVEPLSFVWEDGVRYHVDGITQICKAASLKAGGAGIRYTITVLGRTTFLYRDEDLWFMERRSKTPVLDVHGRPVLADAEISSR